MPIDFYDNPMFQFIQQVPLADNPEIAALVREQIDREDRIFLILAQVGIIGSRCASRFSPTNPPRSL